MLRAYVDYVLIIGKYLLIHSLKFTILRFHKTEGIVFVLLIIVWDRIQIRVGIIVLAQWVTHPIITQEETPHIGMIDKCDSEEVINFTLLIVRHGPHITNRMQQWFFAIGGGHFHVNYFLRLGIG